MRFFPCCLTLAVLIGVSETAPAKVRAPQLNTVAMQSILGIPPSMASIREGYVPKGQDRLHYVLIEDSHDNPEAQGKIAAMLLYAHHHWGSSQAFVEGAFGPVGPAPYPLFSVERGELCVNELLRRGFFSGGELAASLASQSGGEAPASFEVVGMDDPALYVRQLETFEEIVDLQDRALQELAFLSKRLGRRKASDLQRLITLRMTPKDLSVYRNSGRSRFSEVWLERAVKLSENYYDLTDERSLHFAARTQDRVGRAPCLLVLGGFHVAAVTRMLKKRQESFVVLSPHLTQSSQPERYQQCLLRSLAALRNFPPRSLYTHAMCFLRYNLERQRESYATN